MIASGSANAIGQVAIVGPVRQAVSMGIHQTNICQTTGKRLFSDDFYGLRNTSHRLNKSFSRFFDRREKGMAIFTRIFRF
jgi:hypothetical protein